MADETSSIALQLNVQLRGLVNLTKLNAGLVELKKNARGFQQDLGKGNATLGNVGKKAREAAAGLAALTKANKDLANVSRGTKAPNLMQDAFGGFSKQARVNEQIAARSAKSRIRSEQMYARMFDQLERKNTATAATEARKRVSINESAQRSIAASLRKRQSIEEAANRRSIGAFQKKIAIEKSMDKQMGSLTGRLRYYEEQNDAIFRAGFRLQMLGNDMEAVGRKTIGVLRNMATEFGNFEFMVNRAAGATGLMSAAVDKGVNVSDAFSDSIMTAAQELRLFEPTDVAKATYFWASTTGQQINNLEDLRSVMQSINPLMKIAAMTETNYETAIKGVYSILIQYGLGLDQVQQVTEKLHMVTQRTAAEFPDLVNSFKMVGPVAKEFGVTFDDMVVLLGRLADAGIRGTMSGRAFRQFFIQISKPSKPATAALEDLWAASEKFGNKSYLDTVFPAGKFIGVNEYVNELAMRLQGATDKQRMFTLASITTANELPVLTALVSKQIAEITNLGDGWDKSKEDMSKASQGFEQSWLKLRNSWNGTVGALQRGMEIIRIQVGGRIAEMFAPALEEVVKKLVLLRKWFADANNGPMVDFFVKLAGAAGIILAVGGAFTVLMGVLISVVAAARVAVGAFGRYFGAIAKLGGGVAALAVAVIRNFDYIKESVGEAFDIISDAMNETAGTTDALGQAFSMVQAVIGPVMDGLIFVFGRLVIAGANVAAWLMKTKGAMDLVTVAAKILGAIIGLKLVLGFKTLLVSMAGLGGATSKIVGVFRTATTTLYAMNVASGVAGGGLMGVRAALTAALGPLGLVIIAVTAVVAVIASLYSSSKEVKGAIDGLVFEWVTSLEDLRKTAYETRKELGQWGTEVSDAMDLDPAYRALKADIERMKALTAGAGSDGILDDERQNLHALEVLEKRLAAFQTKTYTKYIGYVNDLNAAGSNINLDEFLSRATYEATRLGVEVDNAFSLAKTDQFFRGIMEGSKAADKAAGSLLDTIEKTTASATPDQKSIQLANLINLQSKGNLSSAYADEVTRQINAMNESGIEAVEVPPKGTDEMAQAAMGGIANSLIESAKSAFDIGNQLKEIIKNAVDPKKVGQQIRKHTREWFREGFKGVPPEAVAFMSAQWQALTARNAELAQTMEPGDYSAYANNQINGIMKDLKNGFPADTPEPLKRAITDTIKDLYASMNVPVPPEVLAMLEGSGAKATDAAVTGASAPAQVTKATGAGNAIRDAIANGLRPLYEPTKAGSDTTGGFLKGLKTWQKEITTTSNNIGKSTKGIDRYRSSSWQWGYDLGKNLSDGLRATFKIVNGAAVYIGRAIYGLLHQSVADYGPLRDTDVWGLHLGQNIADGLNRSVGTVRASALNVAKAATMAYTYAEDAIGAGGINVESSSNRLIKIQIEVTSPDNSVDRLKAAELERGLMTSDVILAIEHMAVVG